MEQTRTEIHEEDESQVKSLSVALEKHCEQNEKSDKRIRGDLKKLSWLAEPEFKDTIIRIVKDENNRTWLMIKVAAFLKYAGMVVGIVGGIFAIIWAVWRELRK